MNRNCLLLGIVLLNLVCLGGCGQTNGVPSFGRLYANGTVSGSTSQWGSTYSADSSLGWLPNFEMMTESYCSDSEAGFNGIGAAGGCVQQPSILWANGRWFLAFPQKLVSTAGNWVSEPMASLMNSSTGLFGALGAGLGFLKFLPSTQSARSISLTKLPSGKVISLYWVMTDRTAVSQPSSLEVWSNTFDPSTSSWGTAVRLSSAATLTSAGASAGSNSYYTKSTDANTLGPTDLGWADYGYDAATYISGYRGRTGNFCRPRIATSGNSAMAVWCELRALSDGAGWTTYTPYARYSIYREGVGWAPYDGSTTITSAPVFAKGASTYYGMNSTAATDYKGVISTVDSRGTYHPGMARRMTIPAFEPNALLAVDGVNNHIMISSPVARNDLTLSTNGYDFSLLPPGPVANPGQGVLLSGAGNFVADWTATLDAAGARARTPTDVSSDGTRLAVAYSDTTTGGVALWSTLPTSDSIPDGRVYGNNAAADTFESAFIDGSRLFTADGHGYVRIFNTIPSGACVIDYAGATDQLIACHIGSAGGVATIPINTISGFSTSVRVFYDGRKLYASDYTNNVAYIFSSLPPQKTSNAAGCVVAPPACGTCGNCVAISNLNGPRQVFSDSKRLWITEEGNNRVLAYNRIPGASVDESAANGVGHHDFSLSVTSPQGVFSDGARLFVSGNTNKIYVWRKTPFEDRTYDTTITLNAGANVKSIAWTKYIPSVTSGANIINWPYASGTFADAYSVNPKTTDRMIIQFRGLQNMSSAVKGYLLPSFAGDVYGLDRCTAIGNIVTQINSNAQLRAVGISASLPQEWGEPACGSTVRGNGELFYITHNKEFSPNDGVDTGDMTNSGSGYEDLAVTLTGPDSKYYGRFFDATDSLAVAPVSTSSATYTTWLGGNVSYSRINGYKPTGGLTAYAEDTQFFSGIIADSSTLASTISGSSTTPSVSGMPMLPATGTSQNPDQGITTKIRPVDLMTTGFIDVIGTGNGSFDFVQTSRAIAQPYKLMTCQPGAGPFASTHTSSAGCEDSSIPLGFHAALSQTPLANKALIPSELAFPRAVFGLRFENGDWKRRYYNLSLGAQVSAPQANYIGPVHPFARAALDNSVPGIPLGARWPRLLSNGNGKGIVLFYARDGQRPYSQMSISNFSPTTTPTQTTSPNRLWMATFSDGHGFSDAGIVGLDVEKNNSSINPDRDTCETSDPFTNATFPSTTSTWSLGNGCIVGDDPYMSANGGVAANGVGPADRYSFRYDVPPIPGSMNSKGQAAIGYHGQDTSDYVRFYVATYGPETGLGTFTAIDAGSGYAMGGALAIDESGNIAAVWEARTLTYHGRSTNSGAITLTGCTSSAVPCAENHIYFRYYNASTSSWGSIVQVDSDLLIYNYGVADISGFRDANLIPYNPRALMMPNVAISSTGEIMVSWSGPSCDQLNSSSCRRRLLYKKMSAGSS